MRLQSQDSIKTTDRLNQAPAVNIIQQTRKLVRGKNQKQRFQIAKKHLDNALNFKAPRLDIYSQNMAQTFKLCYNIQTSYIWRTFLTILSYIFMYLVCWQTNSPTGTLITIHSIIILVLWADVFMQIYRKISESFRITSKFQLRFYMKIFVLILLVIDLILLYSIPDIAVRPLLVARCFLPLFYDSNIRKSLQALLMSYKDILVLIIFYLAILVVFGIIANQIIYLPPNVKVDQFADNYRQLDKTLFIIYDLLTNDGYPENQLVAIRLSLWYYAFFIMFIFLNIFFFSTIPSTLLFNSFRQTRSKIVLVDEIKQQHSLIMSFVSLGEQNLNIDQQKLVRFLLYVYKNKMRYVDHITQICRKLDENNNRAIHIKEYMHLCKILQAKTSFLPPKFHDWERWILFRRVINEIFYLKKIVKSKPFKIANSLLILFAFINSILALYLNILAFNLIDDVITYIFVVELFVKIIGVGIQNFFKDPWNNLDFILIILGLIFEFVPYALTPHNIDILIKMTRIFRLTTLFKLFSDKTKDSSSIYHKATRLFSQMTIIMPIVVKFFPIYLIGLYTLGILGMQLFRHNNIINSDSPYNYYEQFSNFTKFIYSQFLLIQILIESQWSTITYDYAYKYKSFILVSLFFVLSHFLLATVLTSLLKGITWEVFNSVHEQFNERTSIFIKNKIKQENLQKKKEQIEQIKELANQNKSFVPDSLIAKQIYEKKIDAIIFKKLKQNGDLIQNTRQRKRKRKRSQMISFLFKQHNLVSNQIQDPDCKTSENQMVCNIDSQFLDLIDIEGDDDLQEQDIEDQMEKVLQQIQLHSQIFYSEATIYPKVLTEYLQFKIKSLKTSFMDDFDIGQDQFSGDQTKDIFVDGINQLLQIQVSEREQKAMILKNMLKQGIITESLASKALTKKADKDPSIDSNWILRKAFLSGTNQKLIKKFQIQYFSNVYGKSFKQINKLTIEPFLRLQSKLTYCLRNALRYRKTSQQKFFTIISTIQQTISNQLLKKGSLFKFVYQIDSISDTWFTIQLRQSNQLRIRFIKNGIWLYHKNMKDNQIMISQDLFNCQNITISNTVLCQKYVKMLFQSFQSLAFCSTNQKNFFQFDPRKHIYDLFTFCKQMQNTQRIKNRNISISKIMLVILSKQDERQQPLSYPLTDILVNQYQLISKSMSFKLDQSQNQTFQKLKQMQLLDHERIIQSQGIPFNYIANLMIQIKEIINLHQVNFVFQLERFLNNSFNVL